LGCRGKWRCCVGPWQATYFKVREPLQTCTPCFHASRTSFPHLEFCYELSMVCALMACYVLESYKCGSSGQIFIRASACSGYWDHVDYEQKISPFSSESSQTSKSRNHGFSFSPHWCMLYAFSTAGLHPPKIGTF
jgi:hypothetical protein